MTRHITRYVDVEVSLDEFSDDDLKQEMEARHLEAVTADDERVDELDALVETFDRIILELRRFNDRDEALRLLLKEREATQKRADYLRKPIHRREAA